MRRISFPERSLSSEEIPERVEYEYLVGEPSDRVNVEKVAVPKSGERAPDLDASDE